MGFLLVVLMFVGAPFVAAYTDAFNVEGQLLCEGQPFANARLVFYEYDYSLSDICFTTTSDRNGTFRAYGYENDGPFKHADQLFYYVLHNCKHEQFGCSRITIDESAWSWNSESAPVYKLEAFDLAYTLYAPCLPTVLQDLQKQYHGPECANFI
ncbi:hypothetical protein M3Y96_00988700 [Aphelenchoides besseyi]|nr:hypothetical protein M3Y96_00988700 [Aphelenchoides besseyi]